MSDLHPHGFPLWMSSESFHPLYPFTRLKETKPPVLRGVQSWQCGRCGAVRVSSRCAALCIACVRRRASHSEGCKTRRSALGSHSGSDFLREGRIDPRRPLLPSSLCTRGEERETHSQTYPSIGRLLSLCLSAKTTTNREESHKVRRHVTALKLLLLLLLCCTPLLPSSPHPPLGCRDDETAEMLQRLTLI